jgi:transcriptional regulator with XRE-family HTH domain
VDRSNSEQNLPRGVFARRLKAARKRRGWTQEDLARRLEEIGYPIGRETLAKIEDPTSTRANARLEDVLALSAALDVPPVHLVVPKDDSEADVTVAAALPSVPVSTMREWFAGKGPLRHLLGLSLVADDVSAFIAQLPEQELRKTARAMGLTEEQQDDFVASVEIGEPVWLSGAPRVAREQVAHRLSELDRERAVLVEQLEDLDSAIRKEDTDG